MKIAVHGLGRMGMQIAHKLADSSEHEVIAHNRSKDKIDTAVAFGAISGYEKEDVLAAFGDEQVVLWLMLPADIVDEEVDKWLALIPKGSIVIDGGNSDYRLTRKLAEHIESAGSKLVDVGTSGGVWGYQNGFSMMAGANDKAAFDTLEPVLQTLAAPEGAYQYFGPAGSGHFVKMTHNAIEYGIMESLAEGYRILKEGPYDGLDLAAAGEVWQHHSVVTSWLNELTRDALIENPTLEGIDGFVAESGEARWTLETAQELGIPMQSIQAAFDVRVASQQPEGRNFATKLLAAMRNKFGGHELNK
ncbi:MAG: gnd, 6-phosphogluconate dehydrogenase, decarboxylating [Candidatus Saccharibacteria bacterium]|nr:gnd, 6-phosphogluconate dehydrogenase, decarboxylating [Candidatus Saccharibacteria bacterium]